MKTMSQSSSVASGVPRFVVRAASFFVLFAVTYLAVLYLAINGASDQLRFTNIPMASPPHSETMLTFREVVEYRDLDILFLGSSHANRSFDPRFFDRFGLRTFTLGTLSQTPLNTYYLMRDHLDRLDPKLVVYEVYWGVLSMGGGESAIDLLGNAPLTGNMVRMALATRNARVFNTLARKVLDRNAPPLEEVVPTLRRDDTYRGRGYVERSLDSEGSRRFPQDRIDLERRQLRYLERGIRFVREAGAEVVLVVQPLPKETIAAIGNYNEIDRTLRALAAQNEIAYIDFNESLQLDSHRFFFDFHHLNQRGVEVFLPRLYDELIQRGLIEAR